MTIWGTSWNLPARFEVTHLEVLYARFKVGQDSLDLLARAEVGKDSQDLLAKFELQGTQDLLGRFEAQTYRDLLSKLVVGQGSLDLPGKLEVGKDSRDLLGKFEAQVTTDLLSRFGVNQDAEDLLGKFEAQAIANLLGRANIIHSEDLLCKFEAQATADLLGRFGVNQDAEDLLGKFEAQAIANLLGKFDAQIIQDLLAKFEVGQGSHELLGKTVIQHDGAPVDLLARFEAQAILDLPARAEVGQDSADLLARAEVGQDSADLLSKAVIIHPAYPVWLFGKFEVGLTNAHRELGSSLEIGRSAFAELLGKFEAQATAELLGKGIIRHSDTAELLGEAVIRHAGIPVELLGNANIRGLSSANLKARMIIFNEKNSDAYFSLWDPSDWINEVVGVGQGFIAIPWVEADAVVKTSGNSSARLTSTSAPNQYKEIRFGWGGMNWGVEAAVPPEVAPTPIDTDGRGPRRGSRASRDRRREVPQPGYKDLPAGLFVRQPFNDLKAQFEVEMAILPGGIWDYQRVWQDDYTVEVGVVQGQIEMDPLTGAVTAMQRALMNDRETITMCGGHKAYSKGTFIFDAKVSIYGGTNPVWYPSFGFVEDKWDWFAGFSKQALMLSYDGTKWEFITEDDDARESTEISGIDFRVRRTFKIIWEDDTEEPPNGKIRLWIDDVEKATHTTRVPTRPLLFFLLTNSVMVDSVEESGYITLYSFNATGIG